MTGGLSALMRRVLFAGIIAGVAAGCVVTLLQMVKLTPLILAAEVFEDAAPHNHAAADAATTSAPGAGHSGHEHGAAVATGAGTEWQPADGLERTAFTLLANIIVGAGFGLLLSGAFAMREAAGGRAPDARQGVLWGLAGFAAFALAPSFGLPPELPGSHAADLPLRQAWWLATAVGTAGGLALLVFTQHLGWRIAGIVLIAAPHIVGAPHPAVHAAGTAPPELAAAFAAASLVTAALFWTVLGSLNGWLYRKLA
ncbi:MAG TPA: CbtA family protein [Stellaceae bacterium]